MFRSGDEPVSIYVHRTGRVTIIRAAAQGDSGNAWPVSAERVYGLIEALADTKFDKGLRTITKCEFVVIGREELLRVIRRKPKLLFAVAKVIGHGYGKAISEIHLH